MKQKKRSFPRKIHLLEREIKRHRSVFAVYLVLRGIVVFSLVMACVRGEYDHAFLCLLVLVLFLLPTLVQQNFGIEFPSTLQIIILVFIFAAEILGELQCYYIHYEHWDTLLHTVWGFLCAAVGYSLVDILNRNERFQIHLSPLYLSLVAFCFSMTIGVLWEFFEFSMDRLFLLDMQKDTVLHTISSVMLDGTNSNIPVTIKNITDLSVNGQSLGLGGYLDIGLYDTMEDLFVNFIGALIFSLIGYFSARKHAKNKLIDNLVPRVAEPNADPPPDTPVP
ncbi:MAG: hypothetical protein VB055_01715 [Oscillospiraceae bacterium]|nr:hypothetical protein [Oscillospiraceae bacterium]